MRDERGLLVLSQAAKNFHPGQGVYRSSYMNARRLAATETNMAYRAADYERWQQLDFVVGIEVHLSNNHTCRGYKGKTPWVDICDELRGKYPKGFKFTGWHPHCRCHATPILKSSAEIKADNERILNGEEPMEESENEVMTLPKGFMDWQSANVERAGQHYTMPYFVCDNPQYINEVLLDAYGVRNPYRTFAEYVAAMRYNRKNVVFAPGVAENIKVLNAIMPVMQGKVMDIDEADRGRCNPMFGTVDYINKGYLHNCQTCTMIYELRRRGFNVNAMANPLVGNERDFTKFCTDNKVEWTERFLNADGTRCEYKMSFKYVSKNSIEAKESFIKGCVSDTGRYEVYCEWMGSKEDAHVFIIERQPNGNLIWFDPQTGEVGKPVEAYVSKMKMARIGVMRIDDKIINPKFVARFLKS